MPTRSDHRIPPLPRHIISAAKKLVDIAHFKGNVMKPRLPCPGFSKNKL